MSATFTLNIKPWAEQVKRLDKRMSQKTFPELLHQQGKLLVQDLILATPPFSKNTINGPLQAQRRVGQKAVEFDIRSLFQPLPRADTIAAGDKKAAFVIRRYLRKNEFDKLSVMLNRLGVRNRGVILEATPGIHSKFRDAKGRTPNKGGHFLVVKSRSIAALLRTMKGHVGKLKSGWMTAARVLKASAPNWISDRGTPGAIQDDSKKWHNPSITVSNNSKFGPKVEFKIVEFALKKREGSMQKQLEALVNAATKNP